MSVNLAPFSDKQAIIEYILFKDSRVVAKQIESLTITGKSLRASRPHNIPVLMLREEIVVSEAGELHFDTIWKADTPFPEETISLRIDCMGDNVFLEQDPDDAYCDYSEAGTYNAVFELSDEMFTIFDTVSIKVQFENEAPVVSFVEIELADKADKVLKALYLFEDPEGDEEGESRFQWYRDGIKIPDATFPEYLYATEESGTEITVGVIPVAQTGTSPGEEVVSDPFTINGTPPIAFSLQVNGSFAEGSTLTVNYNYTDHDDDPEGPSTFQWYRDGNAIADATDSSYSIVVEDKGTIMSVSILPVSQNTNEDPGKEVVFVAPYPVRGFHAPVAKDVSLVRDQNDAPFEVSYTFYDEDNDTEGNTKYTWFSNGSVIETSNSARYSPSPEYAWTYLRCGITPVSEQGDIVEGEMVLTDSLLCVIEKQIMEQSETLSPWEFQAISGTTYANNEYHYDGTSLTPHAPGSEVIAIGETERLWKKDNELILSADNLETSIGTFYRYTTEIAHSGKNIAFVAKETESTRDTFYFYNGTTLQYITPPIIDNYLNLDAIENIRMSGSRVVWRILWAPTMGIYLFNEDTVTRIATLPDETQNTYSRNGPEISGEKIVWGEPIGSNYEIFLYGGATTTQLTDNNHDDFQPQFYGDNIVWVGFDGHDNEIYLYNGTEIVQITNNDENDYNIHVSDKMML